MKGCELVRAGSDDGPRAHKEQEARPGCVWSLGASPAAGATFGSREGGLWVDTLQTPSHSPASLPLGRLPRLCPTASDAKAPAAAPEPGTAFTAAGEAQLLEAKGQLSWWGQLWDSLNPSLCPPQGSSGEDQKTEESSRGRWGERQHGGRQGRGRKQTLRKD